MSDNCCIIANAKKNQEAKSCQTPKPKKAKVTPIKVAQVLKEEKRSWFAKHIPNSSWFKFGLHAD
jgi:hypothetical protein